MQDPSINQTELLAWYVDAGVDIALLDEPVNRFEEAAQKPAKTAPKASPSTPKKQASSSAPLAAPPQAPIEQTIPDAGSVTLAREIANSAKTLEELGLAVEGFEGCNLKFTARSTVFSDGNPNAKIMIIGKAPGRDEDADGIPFTGAIGQLLNRMLAAIQLDRTDVYLTSCVPWRPPGGRKPSDAEIDICRPFIERHIEIQAPQFVILMGGACASMLLQQKGSIMGIRGKMTELSIADLAISALPTLHPEYLLKTPEHKQLAWQDLLLFKQLIAPK